MTETIHSADALDLEANTSGTRMFSGPKFRASVERSLTRAAKQAHLIAYQSGTGVVYARDGLWGVYKPDPAMYEDLLPPDFDRSRVPPQFEDEETFADLPTELPQEFLDEMKALAKSSRGPLSPVPQQLLGPWDQLEGADGSVPR